MSYGFLLDVALILLSTKLLSMLTKRIQMPQVVGALVAGVILGPSVLDVLRETEFISQLSELGVIVLMFTAGTSTDIRELKKSGGPGFLVAMCGVLVPLVMGFSLTWLCDDAGLIESQGFLENVFIGTILTATSVSITVETLKEMGRLNSKVGNTILAAALIDDVLGIVALTIVGSMAGGSESIVMVLVKIVLFFIAAFIAGAFVVELFNWMARKWAGRNRHRYPVLAFVFCLVMSYCAEEFFGVADITGAYAAGLAISLTPKASYIESKFEPVGFLLLTPIFFANIGISVQLTSMSTNMLIFALLLLVVSIISKIVGCGGGAKICRYTNRESLQVGAGMACRGEVALIVANRGLALGVISGPIMTAVIITVVGGTILTPIMLKLLFRDGKPAAAELSESHLVDHYDEMEQVDSITDQLLEKNAEWLHSGDMDDMLKEAEEKE